MWPGDSPTVGCSSAAQQDDNVDEEQADQDEREVDEELLQVPLGLRVHLDLGRSADGRLGHVLDALHGDGLDFGWWANRGAVKGSAWPRAFLRKMR